VYENIRYTLDRTQVPCVETGSNESVLLLFLDIYPAVAALGMWESRGISKRRRRESRYFGFPCFPLPVISNASHVTARLVPAHTLPTRSAFQVSRSRGGRYACSEMGIFLGSEVSFLEHNGATVTRSIARRSRSVQSWRGQTVTIRLNTHS
jgi:hypothetical protein